MLLDAVDLQFRYDARASDVAPGSPGTPAGLVIDHVSLAIAPGEIVGVLGPNGSGKTTLINLLSGALTPTGGTVSIDGHPLARLPRRLLARSVAVVPQETHLAFDYTVLEIVLMGRYPRLGAFEIEGPDDYTCAMDALGATGTRDFASRAFPTLSGGEKQRVIIASALAQLDDRGAADVPATPSILFLDEPTASLDLRYQLELAALVTRLNRERGITMLLSTHDLRLAADVCSTVVLLSRGQILAHGHPRDVITTGLIARLYEIDEALVAPVLR